MAKEILDIYIEQGYPYEFNLDFNNVDGSDLENSYTCYFENNSIGKKQYAVIDNRFDLTLSSIDTDKLKDNMENYVVYVVRNTDSTDINKLLTGRIILDKKKVG